MSHFHSLAVKEIREETPDCVSVVFDIPEELKESFKFIQGQYLTLKTDIGGEEVRRSYSLCSSPLEGEWRVAVKRVEDGKFSTFVNRELKCGDHLDVMLPNGRFYTEVDSDQEKNYAAFAAGSGITPILSIIKTHLELEPKSSFKLFYINQSVSSIILKEEIEGLKNKFFQRFEIFHFLTKEERNIPLFNGRLDKEKLETLGKSLLDIEATDDFFICGPEEMIFLIRDHLVEEGADTRNIHFELFNTSTAKKNKGKKKLGENAGMSEVQILEGGKSFTFNIPQGSDFILDAALDRSADLPFACKGGVCCTCKAKLVAGEVDMEVNYALEQEELDAGYILTCQAVPKSDKVIVDFDS
ncbi:MAG: 1,2-phenylacetyl-CoA epoxidase subunit PaaE [Bacteroidota bacterium]